MSKASLVFKLFQVQFKIFEFGPCQPQPKPVADSPVFCWPSASAHGCRVAIAGCRCAQAGSAWPTGGEACPRRPRTRPRPCPVFSRLARGLARRAPALRPEAVWAPPLAAGPRCVGRCPKLAEPRAARQPPASARSRLLPRPGHRSSAQCQRALRPSRHCPLLTARTPAHAISTLHPLPAARTASP